MKGHAPPADAIVVPDAQFLFHADFKRSGLDLILHKDDRDLVLHDYFKGERHATLASPDGAHLTGDIVTALAGAVDVAQAGGLPAAGHAIGHVTKLVGSATAVRNGVSIILNIGDNVEKGDVVQSGSDSTLGITFIDGTVFGLSSNARMVLNEMVYDPNGSNNSSLLSLVAGTITFVAGETAKHGDMKVDTPVATMGIRGTAVLVEIDFDTAGQTGTPDAKFQVLVEPDGHTGSYILFDKTTLQPLAVVNQAGQQINISNGVISQSSVPLTPDVQKLIIDVFSLKFSDNSQTNPKSITAPTDTLNPQLFGPVIKLASGPTAQPIYEQVALSGGPSSSPLPSGAPAGVFRVPEPPNAVVLDSHGNVATGFAMNELAGKTGAAAADVISGTVNFTDLNAGDQPTVSVTLAHLTLYNAQHQQLADLDASHLAGGSQQINDLIATGVQISVVPASTNNNNGSASWTYSIADKAFDFLGAGETITLTYYVKVDNNFAPLDQSTTVPITITITGTNDTPVITTSARVIDFSGGTGTTGGALSSSDPSHGTLAFTDPDLDDTHTVAISKFTAVMSDGSTLPEGAHTPFAFFEKALTVSLGSDSTGTGAGTIDWQLAQLPAYLADIIPNGETLTLTYTVTVTDSQGATSDQTVTVNITGTDGKAVVWIHTAGDSSPDSDWTTAQNWETGTAPTAADDVIIVTEQLIGLTPSYPVLIDGATHAVVHSLTMNDYADYAGLPAPELDVSGTLTIGTTLSLSADAILKNFGTISVGGKAEFLGHSVLVNSGQLTLQDGGDFAEFASITNSEGGTIEVAAGTLNVSVDLANGGQIAVDADATLALGTATIDGGTVTVAGSLFLVENPVLADTSSSADDGGGTLTLVHGGGGNGVLLMQGSSVLQNGTLESTGNIEVTGTENALHNETVTANNLLDVEVGGALLLDQGTTIVNTIDAGETLLRGGGSIVVEDTASLTLNDATITGGTVMNKAGGTVALTGLAVLQDGRFDNYGEFDVSGSGNVLDGESVSNVCAGMIDITGALALDGSSIINGDGNAVIVTCEASLTLEDASSITGGTLVNLGTVQIEGTLGATFDGVCIANYGTIQVDWPHGHRVTLRLDDGTTIAGGRLDIGDVGRLEIASPAGATLADVTVDNGDVIQVDHDARLELDHALIRGGTLDNDGTISIETPFATVFDDVDIDNHGGTIEVDRHHSPPVTLQLGDGTTVHGGEIDIGDVGRLEIATEAGATLVNVTVDNDNVIQVDRGAQLELDHALIHGGTLDNDGIISVETRAVTTLDGVDVDNAHGLIEVDRHHSPPVTLQLGDGTTIDGGAIDIGDVGRLEIATASGATLADVTVDNDNVIQVDRGSHLELDHALIRGGTLDNDGTISIETPFATVFDGVDVDNSRGTIEVDRHHSPPVTLQLGDGTTVHGGEIDIGDVGRLEIATESGATLVNVTVDNDNVIQVDRGAQLELDHALIRGGTLDNDGIISVETRAVTTLDGVDVDNAHGLIEVDHHQSPPVTLELDDGTTIAGGRIEIGNVGKLEISSAAGATLRGVTVDNDNLVKVDEGSVLKLDGSVVTHGIVANEGTIESAGTSAIDADSFVNDGVLAVLCGTLTIGSHSLVANFGTIEVESGSTLRVMGADFGTGNVVIGAGAAAEFGSFVSSGQTVSFAALTGTLAIDNPWLFAADIAGLKGSGDVLDLGGFNASLDDILRVSAGRFDAATGTTMLTVTDATTHKSVQLTLDGDYAGTVWSAASDGKGGLDVSLTHDAPVIETDHVELAKGDDGHATLSGLQLADSDPTDTFRLSVTTGSASSSVSPSSDNGGLADINGALGSLDYDPTAHGHKPQTDHIDVTVTDQFGATDTVHFIFSESNAPHVTLQGMNGNNVLFATAQSDTLIGGGRDQFVFKPAEGHVQHTVIGFNTNVDTIDLRSFAGIGNWTDVHASQAGHDTLLTLDSHESILLKNVIAASLHAGDFIVTPHTGIG